jgi:hypothetical protein
MIDQEQYAVRDAARAEKKGVKPISEKDLQKA